MMAQAEDHAEPFTRFGPLVPALPLVVAVPHAGRDYPPALMAASRLPVERLAALEDRLVDRMVEGLPALGITGFIARRARAWIDLNRNEREIDPMMVTPAPRPGEVIDTAKVRGGLGLIPRRVAGAGEILTRRISADEVAARIASDHRPWHLAIAGALAAAHARFGIALLIDLHSMPPLLPAASGAPARVVIGDLHGRSSTLRLVERMQAILAGAGIGVALNLPYAGGYTLQRHGRPNIGVHAIQIEFDRSLYLAPDLHSSGDGLAGMTALVAEIARGMLAALDEPGTDRQPLAAE